VGFAMHTDVMRSDRDKWAVRLCIVGAVLSTASAVLWLVDGSSFGAVAALAFAVFLVILASRTRRRVSRLGPVESGRPSGPS